MSLFWNHIKEEYKFPHQKLEMTQTGIYDYMTFIFYSQRRAYLLIYMKNGITNPYLSAY